MSETMARYQVLWGMGGMSGTVDVIVDRRTDAIDIIKSALAKAKAIMNTGKALKFLGISRKEMR